MMNTNELRTLCNQMGYSCRDQRGNYHTDQVLTQLLSGDSVQVGGAMSAEQAINKYGEALRERMTADKTYHGEPLTDELPAVFTVPKYKKYLEWIITSYLSGGIRYFEDIASKVYPALNLYMMLLDKKKLYTGTPGEPWTNQTVITNFCGLLGCEVTRKGKTLQKRGLYAVLDWYEGKYRNQNLNHPRNHDFTMAKVFVYINFTMKKKHVIMDVGQNGAPLQPRETTCMTHTLI